MTSKQALPIATTLGLAILCLSGCSAASKPALMDGRNRVPVNTPEAIAAYTGVSASAARDDTP